MHKVYRNSYCNIAAADAKDSTGGLFREREPHDVVLARFEAQGATTIFGQQKWRVVRGDLWQHGLLRRSLYKRGWVYQGQHMSLPL
jgi:hypothetical protein